MVETIVLNVKKTQKRDRWGMWRIPNLSFCGNIKARTHVNEWAKKSCGRITTPSC